MPFPEKICATEVYEPNIPIAKSKLEPLGVQVVPIEGDEKLPFENEQFDLIINKHEAYSSKELRRIISDNGTFLPNRLVE